MRQLVGQVPRHGTAPVVRHQARELAARATMLCSFDRNQGRDVLHQIFGPVSTGVGRCAGFLETAQVGRHAAVASVLRSREMFQQEVPHKRRFRETMQEHEHRASVLAGGATTQGDAMRQGLEVCFYHGASALASQNGLELTMTAGLPQSPPGPRLMRVLLTRLVRRLPAWPRGAPTATAAWPLRQCPGAWWPKKGALHRRRLAAS